MKKDITLFICFLCTLFVPFVYAKETKVNHQPITGGKKLKSQKPSQTLYLAQRSASKRKISQVAASNSHIIRQTISEHLDAVSKACDENTELSFDKKVENLEAALQKLRQDVHQYLRDPYLTEEDAIYLRSIEYNTNRETLSFAQPLTGELVRKMQLNLGEAFLIAYYLYYGIDNERDDDDVYSESAENIKHEWAEKIYKGLNCIKIETPE